MQAEEGRTRGGKAPAKGQTGVIMTAFSEGFTDAYAVIGDRVYGRDIR